ncbi:hypothetical protein ACVIJ6_004772 [Bradyrhizobium sp. USDA 4369]
MVRSPPKAGVSNHEAQLFVRARRHTDVPTSPVKHPP